MTAEQYVILADQLREDEETFSDDAEMLPLVQMIRYMIHYRPKHRSSAKELLTLPIMANISTDADFNAQEPKRSREDESLPALKSPRQSSSSIH